MGKKVIRRTKEGLPVITEDVRESLEKSLARDLRLKRHVVTDMLEEIKRENLEYFKWICEKSMRCSSDLMDYVALNLSEGYFLFKSQVKNRRILEYFGIEDKAE
jgi:hypothetical protein